MSTNRDGAVINFKLYVAGQSPHSLRALSNLRAFCAAHLPDRHRLEVVDVLVAPERALAERIFLTPQIVIVDPPPMRTVVGDLTDPGPLRDALGLSAPV